MGNAISKALEMSKYMASVSLLDAMMSLKYTNKIIIAVVSRFMLLKTKLTI